MNPRSPRFRAASHLACLRIPCNKPIGRAERDLLTIDATVAVEVIPDLAVITLAAEAQGPDAAPITREVQQIINAALARAKRATSGVEARTGAFSTRQRWNNKGGRDGWTVRAELVLKTVTSRRWASLAGKLGCKADDRWLGAGLSASCANARSRHSSSAASPRFAQRRKQ